MLNIETITDMGTKNDANILGTKFNLQVFGHVNFIKKS